MNFIRKLFEGKRDNWVHKQFTRYGKGDYENKAVLDIRRGKKDYKIKSSFEFAGEFAYKLAESIQNKTKVTGGIISKEDISHELGDMQAGMKQFAGIKTYLIDGELDKEQVQGLFEKFSSNPIFLTFKASTGEIKTKVKSPTSSKPKGSDKPIKADFCTFKTSDEDLVKDLLFDIEGEYKKVFIKHTFKITELEVPEEFKDDLKLARINSIRKGTLIRTLDIDGKEEVKEKSFSA